MNRDEAKFILRSCPLASQDAGDPQFREALEEVKRDPDLADWLAREQALDIRLSEKFRAFPVPPDLKGQLLAAHQVMPLRTGRLRGEWIAAAACLVLATVLAVLLLRPAAEPPFAEFRTYVANTTAKLDHLDVMGRDVAELRHWLQNRGAPGDFVIPTRLSGRPSIGCRVFEWRGQHVSLVCFDLENGHEVHLFVTNRAALRDVQVGTDPQFAVMRNGISTASWSSAQCVYVLATNASEQELKQLL